MKSLTELTKEEYQSFLNDIFDGSVEYNGLKLESNNDGIEYLFKSDESVRLISFSNPELISWLYKKDVDITIPLKQLKYDYVEMDESNSILFEYAMDVNRLINDKYYEGMQKHADGIKDATIATTMKLALLNEKFSEIKDLQRELISKM